MPALARYRIIWQINLPILAYPSFDAHKFRNVTWNTALENCTISSNDVLGHYFRLIRLCHNCTLFFKGNKKYQMIHNDNNQ